MASEEQYNEVFKVIIKAIQKADMGMVPDEEIFEIKEWIHANKPELLVE
jgi:hypothetical protein